MKNTIILTKLIIYGRLLSFFGSVFLLISPVSLFSMPVEFYSNLLERNCIFSPKMPYDVFDKINLPNGVELNRHARDTAAKSDRNYVVHRLPNNTLIIIKKNDSGGSTIYEVNEETKKTTTNSSEALNVPGSNGAFKFFLVEMMSKEKSGNVTQLYLKEDLVIVDGKEINKQKLREVVYFKVIDIERFTGPEAFVKYGKIGNGSVLVITTKK